MDVRTLKKACGVGLVAATALSNPAAHAATGSVNVDVNLPTVLVMYYYSDITLNVTQTALADYLTASGLLGTGGPCAGDYCADLGSAGTIDVTALTATTNVPVDVDLADPYTVAGPVTFVLQNAVGVRGLGCTAPYGATYNVSGDLGITGATNVPITAINGTGCSMTLLTGDLSFDLDFDAIAAGAATVNATLDVTITGV